MTDPRVTAHPVAPPVAPAAAPLPLEAPVPPRPLSRRVLQWVVVFGLLALPPLLMGDNEFRMAQFAKYLALGILALGVDLIWGYTGMLSLGQGVYFALGAYSLAFCLEMQNVATRAGKPPGTVPPGFMDYTNLPVNHPDYKPPQALKYVAPLATTWVALTAAVVLPVVAATLFGLVTFRLRIRGVYLALITQALLLAVYTLVLNQQPYTGGFVGIKNLADLQLFGWTFNYVQHALPMYFLAAGVLAVCLVGCAVLVQSKFGRVLTAIRDNENRVLALGYSPATYKVVVFAIAGALAGIGGALFTAANGLCGPTYLSIAFSINAVIMVAVGGRGTLFGAVLGAVVVSMAEDRISEQTPELWPLFLGCLFVGTVVFLPRGILGEQGRLWDFLRRRWNYVRRAGIPVMTESSVQAPTPAVKLTALPLPAGPQQPSQLAPNTDGIVEGK